MQSSMGVTGPHFRGRRRVRGRRSVATSVLSRHSGLRPRGWRREPAGRRAGDAGGVLAAVHGAVRRRRSRILTPQQGVPGKASVTARTLKRSMDPGVLTGVRAGALCTAPAQVLWAVGSPAVPPHPGYRCSRLGGIGNSLAGDAFSRTGWRVVDPVDDTDRRQMNRQPTVQDFLHKLAPGHLPRKAGRAWRRTARVRRVSPPASSGAADNPHEDCRFGVLVEVGVLLVAEDGGALPRPHHLRSGFQGGETAGEDVVDFLCSGPVGFGVVTAAGARPAP